MSNIINFLSAVVRYFRKPRTAEDALSAVSAIVSDLQSIQLDRLARATAASDRACALEDKITAIEAQIAIANGVWQTEVDERNKALHAVSHIQSAFGLTPKGD